VLFYIIVRIDLLQKFDLTGIMTKLDIELLEYGLSHEYIGSIIT